MISTQVRSTPLTLFPVVLYRAPQSTYREQLREAGYTVIEATDHRDLLSVFADHAQAVLLFDETLPMSEAQILCEAKTHMGAALCVAMLAGRLSFALFRKYTQLHCDEIIDTAQLLADIHSIQERLLPSIPTGTDFKGLQHLFGSSSQSVAFMHNLVEASHHAGRPVLIRGEDGTEVVDAANAVHKLSSPAHPFVVVPCSGRSTRFAPRRTLRRLRGGTRCSFPFRGRHFAYDRRRCAT